MPHPESLGQLESLLDITPEMLAQLGIDDESGPRPTPFEAAVAFVIPNGDRGRRTLTVMPQAIFRGTGLWLWGADSTTLIHCIRSGLQIAYNLSLPPIPGLFFEAGMSFEAFAELLETPSEEWTPARLRELPPLREHQRIHMPTTEIGNSLLLDVEGPLTHAVMWGLSII